MFPVQERPERKETATQSGWLPTSQAITCPLSTALAQEKETVFTSHGPQHCQRMRQQVWKDSLMETEEIEVSHDSKTGEFETVALGWWVSGCGIKICRKLDFISPAAGGKHVLNYCCCYSALQTSQENAEVSVRN